MQESAQESCSAALAVLCPSKKCFWVMESETQMPSNGLAQMCRGNAQLEGAAVWVTCPGERWTS